MLHVGSLEESITVSIADADPAPDPVRAIARVKQGLAFTPFDPSGCVAPAGVGGNIRAPKKLRDLAPQYPEALRGTGTEGIVVLDAAIGLDGFLKNIEVREGANPELAGATVAAVREWQFSQTILNCTPVEPSIKVTTRFISKR